MCKNNNNKNKNKNKNNREGRDIISNFSLSIFECTDFSRQELLGV